MPLVLMHLIAYEKLTRKKLAIVFCWNQFSGNEFFQKYDKLEESLEYRQTSRLHCERHFVAETFRRCQLTLVTMGDSLP